MRIGKNTIRFEKPVYIRETYSIVGPKEGEARFGSYFDQVMTTYEWDEKTFEQSERKMHKTAIEKVVEKAGLNQSDIGVLLCGDLLNQISASAYSARDFKNAYLGLYSACSTIAEAMIIGSLLISGGYFDNVSCSTSSHFCSAERYYRFPLELGTPRTPLSQWTVTGAGAILLSNVAIGPRIVEATLGEIVDYGIIDSSDMGAAMAPAAAINIIQHFKDTGRSPDYYDLIVSGDLGKYGSELFRYLLSQEGYVLKDNYFDCGAEFYGDDVNKKQGGSGAGCSATVFASYLYPKLKNHEINRVLFMPTGALMSKDSSLQGESIPAIGQLVVIES